MDGGGGWMMLVMEILRRRHHAHQCHTWWIILTIDTLIFTLMMTVGHIPMKPFSQIAVEILDDFEISLLSSSSGNLTAFTKNGVTYSVTFISLFWLLGLQCLFSMETMTWTNAECAMSMGSPSLHQPKVLRRDCSAMPPNLPNKLLGTFSVACLWRIRSMTRPG